MKHLKKYNKFLLEAVLNIEDSIIDKLKSYQERKNIPETWKKIANFILEFVGKESSKNRFDLISPDYQNIKNFLVQSGRQKNSQSVSKVIRSILISYGVDFDKYGIKDDTIQKFSHDLIEEINYIEYSDDEILEIKDIFQELADDWNIEWTNEIDWSKIEYNDFLYSFHMKTPGRNNPNYNYNFLIHIILPDRMNTDFTVWQNIDQFVSDISDFVERLKNMGYNNARWNKLLWEEEGHIQIWFS